MHYEVYPKKNSYRSDERGGITLPHQYPCVELVHNYDWDDFGFHDWYSMWYLPSEGVVNYVGDLKIMTLEEHTTKEALGDSFDGKLPDSFCSLGIELKYYGKISSFFNKSQQRTLLSELRDCATNRRIYDRFREEREFKDSLWRELSSQDAYQYGKLVLEGRQLDNAFAFEYSCNIPSSQSPVSLKVSYPYEDCPSYKRSIGIIGENGTGKTMMLSQLSESIVKGDESHFKDGQVPLFDSCVVLCSTPYDSYKMQIDDANIPYKCHSLEQRTKDVPEALGDAINEIIGRRRMIKFKSMIAWYIDTIKENVGESVADVVQWVPEDNVGTLGHFELNKNELNRVVKILSSGQLHLFSLITYVFCDIHYATLLIVDEPEVHLHPHTMVSFMKVLSRVLTLFNSFAIIATHSPLIVREMIKANVLVLRKVDGNALRLTPVAYNTFGEDITSLYYNIFDYDIKDSLFADVISEKAKRGNTYEKIIKDFESDVDLSLNARMLIRDIVDETTKQNAEFEI